LANPVPLTVPEADREVNAPPLGVTDPTPTGGAEIKELKPAPDSIPEAESVVNAPVFGAVLPVGGGDANKFVKPAPDTTPVAESAPTVVAPVIPNVPATVPLPETVRLVNPPATPVDVQRPVAGSYVPS
jgi:hypothetical protein